jgi:hypothetical protein
MNKTTVLAAALLGIFAASCAETAGNGLYSPQEADGEQSGGGGPFREKYAGIFAEAFNKEHKEAANTNGGTVTIVKDITLYNGFPLPLLAGLVLSVDNDITLSVKDGETLDLNGSGSFVLDGKLNMGTGSVFHASSVNVTVNGSLSVGSTGTFNTDKGDVSLYGYMDLGTGLLQGDTKKNGRLTIYPGAVFSYTNSSGNLEELVGSTSIALSVDSKLEIKGGFTSNDVCSRKFTLVGGSATVKGTVAIFNNEAYDNGSFKNNGTASEKIILKDNANIIIDGGTLAILDAVTEHSIGSLSIFIDGADGGTIVCVNNGALMLGTASVLSSTVPTASSAAWSNNGWIPIQ